MKSTMKKDDIKLRYKLLHKWDYVCIVCGREFANVACITKEHIIPKSFEGGHGTWDNLAPSHYSCNQLRGVRSIIDVSKEIDKMCEIMPHKTFYGWLNKKIPSRDVPESALKPIKLPKHLMYSRGPHVLGCLELPEHLPGIR